jgi:hypothetical protein
MSHDRNAHVDDPTGGLSLRYARYTRERQGVPSISARYGERWVQVEPASLVITYRRGWSTEGPISWRGTPNGTWYLVRARVSGLAIRADGSTGSRRLERDYEWRGELCEDAPDWLRAVVERHHPDSAPFLIG